MEKMNNLEDLLKSEVQDLYSVEEQILKALPEMIDKANNADLKKALSEHLRITQEHKNRLEKAQQMLHQEPEGSKGFLAGLFGGKKVCKGMQGIIEEGNKMMNQDMDEKVRDAVIIACAQKVEHYEICGYGTARTYARELGKDKLALMLEQTLIEEHEADDRLTALAEKRINLKAETIAPKQVGRAGSEQARSKASETSVRNNKQVKAMEPVASSRGRGESASLSKDAHPRGTAERGTSGRKGEGASTRKASAHKSGSATRKGRSH